MLRSYINDARGVLALKMALLAPLLILTAGMAIDTSRLYDARKKLQNTADASALSAAMAYKTSKNKKKYKKIAKTSFDTNLDDEFVVMKYKIKKTKKDTLLVNARVALKPQFIQIFGYPKLQTTVNSEVNIWENKTTEIALVIDNSGSLIWNGGYKPLSNALDVFMNTISKEDDMGNLYISFIPWAGAVNVGDEHASWLKPYDNSIYGPDSWHGCFMARPGGLDTTDAPPTGANKFEPFAWPSSDSNNWAGEPVENFQDYGEDIHDTVLGPNAGCPMEMVPLTNKRHKVIPAIDEYQTHIQRNIGTFSAQAMVWGYRALSAKWQGYWKTSTPQTIPSTNGNKIIVFLTDGFDDWNEFNNASSSHYSPYGFPTNDFLNADNPADIYSVRSEMEKRFAAVCDNIKADGIEIYTIGYFMKKKDIPIYEKCATSLEHAYHAPGKGKIKKIFREIAKKVTEKNENVRIVN